MDAIVRARWTAKLVLPSLLVGGIFPGCALVPRDRIEESQRLTQTLRTENARLKDQVLALQVQNQDYADRALDDLRRMTSRDEAIERLEQSVHGYQDDRDRLAAAYRRLTVSLGRSTEDSVVESTGEWRGPASELSRPSRPDSRRELPAENVTSKDDGYADSTRSRSSADGSGP
jgi:hypothetical protein